MAKVERTPDEYITTGGDRIPGLIHHKVGRWRILATGKRFSADSGSEAITRFHRMQGRDTVSVPTRDTTMEINGRMYTKPETLGEDFWPWLREFIITQLPLIA